MAAQISPRDLQALSEYLDYQMHPKRRAALEERIEKSPELRQAVNDLLMVKRVLQSQGRNKSPRNFTLTPAMLGQVPRQPAAVPVLRLAAILISILLIFFAAGDFLTSPSTFMIRQPAGALTESMFAEPMSAPEIEAVVEAPAEAIPEEEPMFDALMEGEPALGEEAQPEMELKAMEMPAATLAPAPGPQERQPEELSGKGMGPSDPSIESIEGAGELELEAKLAQEEAAAVVDEKEVQRQSARLFLGISRFWLTSIEIILALLLVSVSVSFILIKKNRS
jgi:anti-sigma factor RsiW